MKLTPKIRNVHGQRENFAIGPNATYILLTRIGFYVGGNTNFSVCIGVTQILALFDINMLVFPMQNFVLGV